MAIVALSNFEAQWELSALSEAQKKKKVKQLGYYHFLEMDLNL